MLRAIEFDDGARLIVETEDRDSDVSVVEVGGATKSLPDGAEPVSTITSMSKAAAALGDLVAGLATLAQVAVTSARPSEIEIQAHVKFTSDVEPIPFLASARGEGGLKLTLTWEGKTSRRPVGVEDSKNDKSA